jgi:uncharacterized protein with PIN domain
MNPSTFIKVLKESPFWKRLTALPDKVDALERRIAEIENNLNRAPGEKCKYCGSYAVRKESEKVDYIGGEHDLKTEIWRCQQCSKTEIKSDVV